MQIIVPNINGKVITVLLAVAFFLVAQMIIACLHTSEPSDTRERIITISESFKDHSDSLEIILIDGADTTLVQVVYRGTSKIEKVEFTLNKDISGNFNVVVRGFKNGEVTYHKITPIVNNQDTKDVINILKKTGEFTVTLDSKPDSVFRQGDSATITATVSEKWTYTYQWYLDGSFIRGADSSSFSIASDSGKTYSLYTKVGDGSGYVQSSPITIKFEYNVDLSNLEVSEGNLTPTFSPEDSVYLLFLDSSIQSFTLTPTVSFSQSKIQVNKTDVTSGSPSQSIGAMAGKDTVIVQVSSNDDKVRRNYIVEVFKPTTSDSFNLDLFNLALSGGELTPVFSPSDTLYSVYVPFDIKNIFLTPIAQDARVIITIAGDTVGTGSTSDPIPLIVGINSVVIEVYSPDGKSSKRYLINVTRGKENSYRLTLLKLEVSVGILDPVFDSQDTVYGVFVEYADSQISITPTSVDPSVVISVQGMAVESGLSSDPIDLKVGVNLVNVRVSSPNNENHKTYTLSVLRARVGANTDATLSQLKVSEGTLVETFKAGDTVYTLPLPFSTSKITITPTSTDTGATITVNGTQIMSDSATDFLNVPVGLDTIVIAVTAEDNKTKKTYRILVTRTPNSEATLSALTISKGQLNPDFSSSVEEYVDTISHFDSGLVVTPTVTDQNAKITVNGKSLASGQPSDTIPIPLGKTNINIEVTAQDDTTQKTYKISIIRPLNSNASLAKLTLSAGTLTPVFSSSDTVYTVALNHLQASISVTPTGDSNATITVKGEPVASGSASSEIPMSVGTNQISIQVTAQNGTSQKTYQITITRSPSLFPPTFSPTGGVYDTAQSISLASVDTGITIRYTVDGVDPDSTSTKYSMPIQIKTSITIKAFALKAGFNSSDIITEIYALVYSDTVVTLVASPPGGTYTSDQSVTLTTTTPGATIHYTLDGSIPNAQSTIYSGPVAITGNTTLKAIGLLDNFNSSTVREEIYSLKVTKPVITPPGGTYDTTQNVELTTVTPGARIHYTLDGTDPSPNSPQYSNAITINGRVTLKAVGYKDKWTRSEVIKGEYFIVTFAEQVISSNAIGANSAFAIDVDGDGDIDVLSASNNDDKIAWYENNGSEIFTAYNISDSADGGFFVYAVDMDGDGDMDVLSASSNDDKIAWYENDGNENFTAYTITDSADGTYSVFAVDVDGDGDMDVLSASRFDYKIAWYENDGNENFTTHIIPTTADSAFSVYAVDMDGDGDMDVLSASNNNGKIAWYENDGNENFTAYTITTNAASAWSVYAADVNGDGNMDVLSASFNGNKIAWYENDGSENFTDHIITTTINNATSVFAVDVDGDGDMDVLSASFSDNKIVWYENDSSENFTAHIISNNANGANSVYAVDVDGDGDMDVLSSSFGDNKIAWYENKLIP